MSIPAVIGGVAAFLQTQTTEDVWDGEVPRFDTEDGPISPQSPTEQLPSPIGPQIQGGPFPVVRLTMDPGGTPRSYQFNSASIDNSHVTMEVGGVTRESTESLLDALNGFLTLAANWSKIDLQSPGGYVIHVKLLDWDDVQEEGVRTGESEMIYKGSAKYEVRCRVFTKVQ